MDLRHEGGGPYGGCAMPFNKGTFGINSCGYSASPAREAPGVMSGWVAPEIEAE